MQVNFSNSCLLTPVCNAGTAAIFNIEDPRTIAKVSFVYNISHLMIGIMAEKMLADLNLNVQSLSTLQKFNLFLIRELIPLGFAVKAGEITNNQFSMWKYLRVAAISSSLLPYEKSWLSSLLSNDLM